MKGCCNVYEKEIAPLQLLLSIKHTLLPVTTKVTNHGFSHLSHQFKRLSDKLTMFHLSGLFIPKRLEINKIVGVVGIIVGILTKTRLA